MDDVQKWRIRANSQRPCRISVSLNCDDQDAIVNGAIQEFSDESIRVHLGDRPPSITDPMAMRLLVAIYQYLNELPDEKHDEVTEDIEIDSWLYEHLGNTNAVALWMALSEEHIERQKYPPPTPFEETPTMWHFSARWEESPRPDWRLARLSLMWHREPASGGLEVFAKVARRGDAMVSTIIRDDLLLAPPEMDWLFRQLLERFWNQILTRGDVSTAVEDFSSWMGRRRGSKGQTILRMIQTAVRTFKSCQSQQG